MELSADNIEELAIAITGNSIEAENGSKFQKNAKSCNLSVDQVIGDAQDCLLNSSIEPIRSLCSFNDILDDIYEMDKTLELGQATANKTSIVSPIIDVSISSPAIFNMPDITLQGEFMPDCSFSNQTDFLQPLEQWPDYLLSPPSAFNTIQEIPQLAFLPTTTSSITTPNIVPTQQVTPSEVPAANVDMNFSDLQLVCSPQVAPVQYFNNYHFNFSPTMAQPPYAVQHCDSPILAPAENAGVAPKEQPPVAAQKCGVRKQHPSYDWARVVPRKQLVRATEVLVLRPFRTRKSLSSRQTLDLASYFDTSSIKIPMIRERPRKNANRRKQKLSTIMRADNLKFEIQVLPPEAENESSTDINHNVDQFYPETEIPELDEIFKRKRRSFTTSRVKRVQASPSSHSMERENANEATIELSFDRPSTVLTESDVDSDDAPLTVLKSMKCQNCRKLFKTSRSLTIHSKRCDAVRPILVSDKPPDIPEPRSARKSSLQSNSSKENVDGKNNYGKQTVEKSLSTRPLTRSQTNAAKRKTGFIEDLTPIKRFK